MFMKYKRPSSTVASQITPRIVGYDKKWSTDSYFRSLTKNWPLSIRYDSIRGRGLFAKKSFKEGEILWQESPLVSISYGKKRPNTIRCEHCYRVDKNLIYMEKVKEKGAVSKAEFTKILGSDLEEFLKYYRKELRIPNFADLVCETCQKVHFCSEECKKAAKASYHGFECENSVESSDDFMKLIARDEADGSLLLFKTMATMYQQRTQNDEENIWNHLKRMCYVKKGYEETVGLREIEHWGYMLRMFPKEYVDKLDATAHLVRIKSILNLNTIDLASCGVGFYGVMPDSENMIVQKKTIEMLPISALYILASYLNHSCLANVAMLPTFEGHAATFVASRDIQEGEELTWRYYGKPELSREHIRQEIFNRYYFWCECPKCKPNK